CCRQRGRPPQLWKGADARFYHKEGIFTMGFVGSDAAHSQLSKELGRACYSEGFAVLQLFLTGPDGNGNQRPKKLRQPSRATQKTQAEFKGIISRQRGVFFGS